LYFRKVLIFMGRKKRIFIAEDQTILRQGLKALLATIPDFEVVGEAEDGKDAIRGVEEHSPDLIILDLSMPRMNGLEAIKEIKQSSPETKILVLTMHDEEEYIFPTFKAGADGYLLKVADENELLSALKQMLEGKSYITPGISGQILEDYRGEDKTLQTLSFFYIGFCPHDE